MPYCARCQRYSSSADLRRTKAGLRCRDAKSCAIRVMAVQVVAKAKART